MSVSSMATAQPSSAEEYAVKAAYMYNFAKFTEWPEKAFAGREDPIVLGLFGEDRFGLALDAVDGKRVKDRRLHVKRPARASDFPHVHILYISPSEKRRLDQIFSALEGHHVLTVSDLKGFARSGGMINLVRQGDKIRFEINLRAARRAGLTISSKLLSLATIVDGTGRGEKE